MDGNTGRNESAFRASHVRPAGLAFSAEALVGAMPSRLVIDRDARGRFLNRLLEDSNKRAELLALAAEARPGKPQSRRFSAEAVLTLDQRQVTIRFDKVSLPFSLRSTFQVAFRRG